MICHNLGEFALLNATGTISVSVVANFEAWCGKMPTNFYKDAVYSAASKFGNGQAGDARPLAQNGKTWPPDSELHACYEVLLSFIR